MSVDLIGKMLVTIGADTILAATVQSTCKEPRRLDREAAARGAASTGGGAGPPGSHGGAPEAIQTKPPKGPRIPMDTVEAPVLQAFYKYAFGATPPAEEAALRTAIKRMGGAVGQFTALGVGSC